MDHRFLGMSPPIRHPTTLIMNIPVEAASRHLEPTLHMYQRLLQKPNGTVHLFMYAFLKNIFGTMTLFIVFNAQTLHIKSKTHNSIAVFSLKTLYPGVIRTRVCCLWGWCDVHCATPPRHLYIYTRLYSSVRIICSVMYVGIVANVWLWNRRSWVQILPGYGVVLQCGQLRM
jgi:hypothetical protein